MKRSADIADCLAAEVTALASGARLPGEHALMQRFDVGRAAIRAALHELERQLLVRRVQGSGTYVNRRIDYVLSRERRPSWHETVVAAGARPRSVVRAVEPRGLPAGAAELLGLAPGTPAHLLRRLSYIDDVLAACGQEWVPVARLPDPGPALQAVESLDAVLRQVADVDPVRAWTRVSLDIAPPEVVADLGLDTASPAWLVESVNTDGPAGPPVMCSKSWMRADAVRVVVELGP